MVEAQVPAARLGADKDFEGNAGVGAYCVAAAAFIFICNHAPVVDGGQDMGQDTVFQGMDDEVVLELEQAVAAVFPVQDGASDKTKGRCLLEEFHGVHKMGPRRVIHGKPGGQGVDQVPA